MKPNTIYCGDCLEVLQKNIDAESVDLIYIDPPFGSGENYEIVFKDGVEIRHFKDRWDLGKEAYLKWIEPRIRECHRVLKRTGSFYLHCDWHLNANLRVLCDEIFVESGGGRFHNEIIWRRTNAHNNPNRYGTIHDTILFYTKSDNYTFNFVKRPFFKKYIESNFRHRDERGYHSHADLTGPGIRKGDSGKPWRGYDPTAHGRHWQPPSKIYDQIGEDISGLPMMERLDRMFDEGLIYMPDRKGGQPRGKIYLQKSDGIPLQDIWAYQPFTDGIYHGSDECIDQDVRWLAREEEREGFPTQKPVGLLERIVNSSSKKGDLVLDPMCGCGTTLVAARKGERKWIGVDISPTACKLMARRLHELGDPIMVNDIIDLPRTMKEVKRMVALDPIEFQNWVCDLLSAVSTTPRGRGPMADQNIDGWILSMIPIQVKGSDGVGVSEVERFLTTLRKRGKKEGYIVAFSFTRGALQEAMRIKREEGIVLDLLELSERRVPNPRYPDRPEVNTFLESQITKRVWGSSPATQQEARKGPNPP